MSQQASEGVCGNETGRQHGKRRPDYTTVSCLLLRQERSGCWRTGRARRSVISDDDDNVTGDAKANVNLGYERGYKREQECDCGLQAAGLLAGWLAVRLEGSLGICQVDMRTS